LRPTTVELCMLSRSTITMLESDLKEAIRLGNVQRAQIEHLQSLQARQTTPISPGEPAERSVPPPLGAGGEATTAEAGEGQLQEHFNALLQVLSRRCLNNRDYIVEQEQAQVLSRGYLDDIIASLSLSHSHCLTHSRGIPRSLAFTLSRSLAPAPPPSLS
jgi:hypothetical protein